jgi:O-antigen/teichoic acid export membrane protein
MASLSDKAGFLITANFIKYAVGFVLPMVMVRLLTQEDYGTYQQLLLVNLMALGLLTAGLPSSVYYFYNRVEARQRGALVAQTLSMLAILGAVATAGIALGAPLIGERASNHDLATQLPLYAVAVGLMLASEHFVPFMIAQDRYGVAVWFETIETVARVATLVLPVVLGYGLRGLVVAAVLYAAARIVVRTLWLCSTGPHPLALPASRAGWFFRDQLAYSIPLWLSSIVAVFGGFLDRALIAGSFTPVDYAIYTVGALAIPLDVIFQGSVADVLRASLPPLVKDGNMREVARLLREAVRKLALIMVPSFVFLLGYSAEFITVLFTEQYAQSVHVFRIYLFGIPLYMLVLSLVPQVLGKTRIHLNMVVAMTIAHIALSFVLLKTIGFYGPALSGIICGYVGTAIYLRIASRLVGAPLPQMLPLPEIAKTLACAVGALGLSRLVHDITPWKLLDLAIDGAIFAIAFAGIAAAVRLFTAQDILLARRWAAKLRLAS